MVHDVMRLQILEDVTDRAPVHAFRQGPTQVLLGNRGSTLRTGLDSRRRLQACPSPLEVGPFTRRFLAEVPQDNASLQRRRQIRVFLQCFVIRNVA